MQFVRLMEAAQNSDVSLLEELYERATPGNGHIWACMDREPAIRDW